MNAYSLFVQDAQKSARDAAVDWRNLSEEAKQVRDPSTFVLETVHI